MNENKETEQPQEKERACGSAVERIVMPDLETKWFHVTIGIVLTLCTFGIFFIVWYGALLNRDNYYNRKKLYDYLMKHGLPKPVVLNGFTTWTIKNLEITKHDCKWYVFDGMENKICSFVGGLSDSRRYEEISNMLEA